MQTTSLQIPSELLPRDGRFGSGPSKIRKEQADRVAQQWQSLMGTSHRQAPVKNLVHGIREKLTTLFETPVGYDVVLGLGGATQFWDAAACSLVRHKAQHLVFGEFTAKFASATARAPFLQDPSVRAADPGSVAAPLAEPGIDVYAWAHNETSTGAMTTVERVSQADDDALVLIDATSAAAGLPVDIDQCDVYYFSPQKGLASEGGLWFSLMSPAALERIAELTATDRWIPDSLNLQLCVDNSRKDQTLNTPALATLILMDAQLDWILAGGGLSFATERTAQSAAHLYEWADRTSYVTPFVHDPAHRSQVVGTIDFDDRIDAKAVARTLRANGVVDTDPYRKLGRNQLRIGMFPAVDPADVEALTHCIDWVVEHLPQP